MALEGYLAIAPELYCREGDPNDFADIPTCRYSERNSQVLADLRSCRQLGFPQRRRCSSLMITGFCFGGRYHLAVCRA
ncbi:dienelactone hydrolase family protein [Escherichia coli]